MARGDVYFFNETISRLLGDGPIQTHKAILIPIDNARLAKVDDGDPKLANYQEAAAVIQLRSTITKWGSYQVDEDGDGIPEKTVYYEYTTVPTNLDFRRPVTLWTEVDNDTRTVHLKMNGNTGWTFLQNDLLIYQILICDNATKDVNNIQTYPALGFIDMTLDGETGPVDLGLNYLWLKIYDSVVREYLPVISGSIV